MCRRVALVRTEVSTQRFAFIFRMRKISELGTTLSATSSVLQLLITAVVSSSLIFLPLKMEEIYSSETSVLTRATLRHIPDDDILRVHTCFARVNPGNNSTPVMCLFYFTF
jgi:hypothetical protein